MKIEVVQEDIDNGIPEHCEFCPIALAIRRATGNLSLNAGLTRVFLSSNKNTLVPFPIEVTKWIEIFDVYGKKSVKPFTFELPLEKFCVT